VTSRDRALQATIVIPALHHLCKKRLIVLVPQDLIIRGANGLSVSTRQASRGALVTFFAYEMVHDAHVIAEVPRADTHASFDTARVAVAKRRRVFPPANTKTEDEQHVHAHVRVGGPVSSNDDVKMEDIPTLSAEQERRIHELEAAHATERAVAQEEIARLHEERIRALEAAQAARDAATRAEIARIRAAPAATVKREVKPLTHRGVSQPGEVVDLTMEH
jgi:hypothetical protein